MFSNIVFEDKLIVCHGFLGTVVLKDLMNLDILSCYH